MTNFVRKAALAATAAAVLAATPALAAGGSDSAPFTAKATIVKPITLTKVDDLDFGTITLGNALTSSDVTVARTSTTVTCGDGSGTDLTCSGAARGYFTLSGGVGGQVLDISSASSSTLDNVVTGDSVPFTFDAPATVTLASDGTGDFYVGGSITVSAGTDDGYYDATFDVTATYQ